MSSRNATIAYTALVCLSLSALAGCSNNPRPPATDIWKAASDGNIEAVKQHLAAGTDINGTFVAEGVPGSGGSPLHIAVLAEKSEVAQLLIDSGADLNVKAQDAAADTPLGWAAAFGKTDMAKLLIDGGADLQATNANGSTPLHTAAFLCCADTVELLLESGADVTAKDSAGTTPLEGVAGEWSPELEGVYKALGAVIPLDLEKIKSDRPKIAELLRQHSGATED